MSKLEQISVPEVTGVTLSVDPKGRLALTGTIATRDPASGLAPFFRDVHAAALADAIHAFTIDLTGLTFVNSSAIRLFIDWVTWVKEEPASARYRVVIAMNPQITWQRTNLGVLKSIAPDVIELQEVR